MEIDASQRLGSHDEIYDYDSDYEDFVEDSVHDKLCSASSDIPKLLEDSVHDKLSSASSDISKLQFRKETSKARWIEELGMAEVLEKKVQMWSTIGIVRDGRTYCSIEETSYLAKIGALDILNGDNTPIPLKDMFAKLAEDKDGYAYPLESFWVYQHLKFLGYIVGRRHGVPWSMNNVKIKIDAQEAMAVLETGDL